MIRCLIDPQQVVDGTIVLTPRQRRHLIAALRLRAGDEFIVMVEQGLSYLAVLEQVRGSQAAARIVRTHPLPPPEPWQVTVAVALPKHPGTFDQIVNQATQLGASAIIPMVTARTVVQPDRGRLVERHRRWERVAREACQQAGRRAVPAIAWPTEFSKILQDRRADEGMLVPAVGVTTKSLADSLQDPVPTRLLLLIGPEGDFTPAELAAASAAGARVVSLGPWVLRCETAVAVSLGIVLHVLRDRGAKNLPPP